MIEKEALEVVGYKVRLCENASHTQSLRSQGKFGLKGKCWRNDRMSEIRVRVRVRAI